MSASRKGLLKALVLYAVGFGLLVVIGVNRSAWWLIIPGLVLLAAAFAMGDYMRESRKNPGDRSLQFIVLLLMLLFGILALAGSVTRGLVPGWGFFGVSVLFAGVGHLVDEFRHRLRARLQVAVVGLFVCATLFTVGVLGTRFQSEKWLIAAGLAIAVSPVLLGVVTDGTLARLKALQQPQTTLRWIAVAGLVLTAAGFLVLLVWLPVGFAVTITVALFVLIGAIASRTMTDVILVGITAAAVWSLMPQIVEPGPELQAAANEKLLVALGDSYMSGEGAKKYYRGTNDEGTNECRQAPTAYAHLVLADDDAPKHLAFLACSAAKSEHIYKTPQQPYNTLQLDALKGQLRDATTDISLVIVSIGGNDAQFGTIGRACVGPGDCTVWGQKWLDELKDVAPRIDRAYQEIRGAVGNKVPILAVPYPVPLNDKGCDWSLLTSSEHKFLHGYSLELNKVVRHAALQEGFHYLEAMPQALERENLRICDGKPEEIGANSVAIGSVRGLFQEKLTPVNWFHNSLHPNERGHEAMRDVLVTWVEDNRQAAIKPDPAVDTAPPTIASLATIMGDAAVSHCGTTSGQPPYCDRGVSGWTIAQLTELGYKLILGLLPIVAGCWLLWLLILRWNDRTRWFRRLFQRRAAANSGTTFSNA